MAKSPTTASAPEPTSSPSEEKDQGAHNLRLWNVLGKTDPRHTKRFTRGGGFKGTAVKPMWQNKQLTEMFGPAGVGWGTEQPEYQIVDGANGEKLVYCTIAAWYRDPETGEQSEYIYGVGGDKIIAKFSSGLSSDDEAFKKAYTDALGNAFKFVGVAADVHMGQFDDSKYVADLQAEFEKGDDVLGKEVDALLEQVRTCEDLKVLTTELLPVVKDKKQALEEAKRKGEAQMLTSTYNARKQKLTEDLHKIGSALSHEPEEPADQA